MVEDSDLASAQESLGDDDATNGVASDVYGSARQDATNRDVDKRSTTSIPNNVAISQVEAKVR